MKILMLTLYLPYPPTSGGQIRSYNLIKNLSKKHQITLFSIIKKGEEKYAEELEKYCKEVIYSYRSTKPWTLYNIVKTCTSFYPFLMVRNTSAEGKRVLQKKLASEKFDLIHVETFYLMPHVPPTRIPTILVDQTIEFEVYQHFVDTFKWWFMRPILSLEVMRLKYWETRFWKEAQRVVAVSQADKDKMTKFVPASKVGIIPNAPGDDLADLYDIRTKPDFENPVIFFQSNFLWLQNVEGARVLINDVFPLVKEKIPNATCVVVGQNTVGKIGNLSGDGVVIKNLETSDVEGVRQAYLQGTVFVAPLWGPGGTRLKILSAMSTGVPVVTTPVGATGIEVIDGKHLLIGSTPQQLADSIVQLLQNKNLYKSIVTNARELIEKKYSWKTIAADLSRIYEETARQHV